ncbi:membrane alanyl aminopeptidase-like isoform X2 [Anticarsia gemmatalis]|uniref:membrane alanyl aminopeptidase-like isoform X2 n=1 Tax=Anticarsia gemmatalis TaxID=129554 RepID=UPI003F766914
MGVIQTFVFLTTLVLVSTKPIDIVKTAVVDEVPQINVVEDVVVRNDTNVAVKNETESRVLRNQIRPDMVVNSYEIELTPNADGVTFTGLAVIQIAITDANTREDPVILHARDLDIRSVRYTIFGAGAVYDADFDMDDDDGLLEIDAGGVASTYNFQIQYIGSLAMVGKAFYRGNYDDNSYLAMNLHPIYARRVFPCIDEPTASSMIRFTFNGLDYTHLVSNSMLEENSQTQFRALESPPHVWGMIAHNFININIPTAQVLLFGRAGITNQDAQASVAINYYYNQLNEWTNRPYLEIIQNQDGRMNIVALPDISMDWHALSTVAIWEPHLFMEPVHSVQQRKTALFEIAKAMAKQWFGYLIFPQNWKFEWVVSGLASYAAYEMLRMFQADPNDVTLLDVNTVFVTDVIQESLLRDAYVGAQVLEPENDLFEEDEIRDHVNGLLKYKAPALLRMMRLVLGDANTDFIQSAGRALLTVRALTPVNSFDFVDAINSDWLANGNGIVDDIGEYLEEWTLNSGYPLLHVGLRQGGVLITQERFSFAAQPQQVNYLIPITYTTSVNPDFSNVHPITMTDATQTINFFLDEEDWVLFNIQGEGYYRVNYDNDLWERIIEALEDEERREEIHPLNRATLVDDALNLARAGRLDYETAFRVVLTMELETEYAVWKAFIRNMEFLRKRLVALVDDDEDLDPDIYLRMVRRTIGALENELGFQPDVTLTEPAMTTLTRGMVMEHACISNYQPCIAAAVDWFYEGNTDVVNPNIPHDLRPAVYCTMVREAEDGGPVTALYNRLEIEPTLYERTVILESLACSRDQAFIRTLLDETVAVNSPYSVEERSKIFAAVARTSHNTAEAINFISRRTNEIRNMYGGPEKLEEIIFILAENMADNDMSTDFSIWVNAQNNNLDDSQAAAERALLQVNQNLVWDNANLEAVYEWIDENDASTMVLSLVALCVSVMVAMLNH